MLPILEANKTLLPSTAMTPADALVTVVSDALPILIAVNCGLSVVPNPRLVLAVVVLVNSDKLLEAAKYPVPEI